MEANLLAKIKSLEACQDEAELKRCAEAVGRLVQQWEEELEETAALDPAQASSVASKRSRLSQLLVQFNEAQKACRQSIRLRMASMEKAQLLRHRLQNPSEAATVGGGGGAISGTLDRISQRLAEEIEKSSHNYSLLGILDLEYNLL